MKLGNKAIFKTKYLNGYPIVNLSDKHFDIKPGYKFSSASYIRPTTNEKVGIAKVILVTKYGDVIEENIEIEFRYSESERVIKALKPSSFKVRESALLLDNPEKMKAVDFINIFSDVLILSVKSKKTKIDDVWNILLKVRFINSKVIYDVLLPIDYKNLSDVSDTGMIPLYSSPIKDVDLELITTFDEVYEFELDENFSNGSPPVKVDPKVVIPNIDIKILDLVYIPPIDIDSKQAIFKIVYKLNGISKKVSKLISFRYAKTIREAANLAMKETYSTDFKYKIKNRLTLPLEIKKDEFEYLGKLHNLEIVDVEYNYSIFDKDKRFVPVNLIIKFKDVYYKVEKIIEFAYSKEEYSSGSFREVYQESDSIIIPKEYGNAIFLDKVVKNDQQSKKDLILYSKISKNYKYTKILDIKITRFFKDSKLVILLMKVEEIKGKVKIIHNFEKIHILDETLNEMLLYKMNLEDIKINEDILPLYPSSGKIDRKIFTFPKFAKLDSIQFSKIELDSNTMHIQLKFIAGDKIKFLEKQINFKFSINEYLKYKSHLNEKEYLENWKPNDIMIKVDTNSEPVDSISKDDILGVPEGFDVELDYRKPEIGNKNARLFLKLKKGNYKIVFEQSIMFQKPVR